MTTLALLYTNNHFFILLFANKRLLIPMDKDVMIMVSLQLICLGQGRDDNGQFTTHLPWTRT